MVGVVGVVVVVVVVGMEVGGMWKEREQRKTCYESSFRGHRAFLPEKKSQTNCLPEQAWEATGL